EVSTELEELEAKLRAEAGGHSEGDEVGELGERALAEDDRPGRAQLANQRRVVLRLRSAQRDRAGGRRHVESGGVVLAGDWVAEQRPAGIGVELVRVVQSMRVDAHVRVERLVAYAAVDRLRA